MIQQQHPNFCHKQLHLHSTIKLQERQSGIQINY